MLRWGMIMLFLPSIVLVTLYTLEVQDVAQCEQIKGSWDYVKGLCDMDEKHEFIPYSARHGWAVNIGMLISIVGLVMGTWGMIMRGMGKPKD